MSVWNCRAAVDQSKETCISETLLRKDSCDSGLLRRQMQDLKGGKVKLQAHWPLKYDWDDDLPGQNANAKGNGSKNGHLYTQQKVSNIPGFCI